MNLSDVKTQSPPESGLPSAVRLGDHKSRGIYNRISYTYWHAVCNTDVKELMDSHTCEREREERKRARRNAKEKGESGESRERREITLANFVRREGEGKGRRKKKTGEIAWERRKLQTRKLSSSYYLRRDHGPASRELSSIPRSLNTPPSASYRLGRELFSKVEKGTASARPG